MMDYQRAYRREVYGVRISTERQGPPVSANGPIATTGKKSNAPILTIVPHNRAPKG